MPARPATSPNPAVVRMRHRQALTPYSALRHQHRALSKISATPLTLNFRATSAKAFPTGFPFFSSIGITPLALSSSWGSPSAGPWVLVPTGLRSRPPLCCVVDSSCLGLPGARRPACTTHQSSYRLARILVWGPACVKRWPAFPESHGTQRKPTTNQLSLPSASRSWLPMSSCSGPKMSRAPDGNPRRSLRIVQERPACRTDCQTVRVLPALPSLPASLDTNA